MRVKKKKNIQSTVKFLNSPNTDCITPVASPPTPHVWFYWPRWPAANTQICRCRFNAAGGERRVMPAFTPFAQTLALAKCGRRTMPSVTGKWASSLQLSHSRLQSPLPPLFPQYSCQSVLYSQRSTSIIMEELATWHTAPRLWSD